jgi:hypothetical protein
MKLLRNLFGKKREPVIVVSGLPRSGTSMMMKMLAAGGLEIVTDNLREPNVDNPKGYFEFERVKKLPDGDTAWLVDAQGKVVKIISALLKHLPAGYTYKVLFMQRRMEAPRAGFRVDGRAAQPALHGRRLQSDACGSPAAVGTGDRVPGE